MDINLKPCPFCGGEATLMHIYGKNFKWSKIKYPYVKCSCCSASTGLRDTEQQAIAVWNRRADDE